MFLKTQLQSAIMEMIVYFQAVFVILSLGSVNTDMGFTEGKVLDMRLVKSICQV